MYSITTKIRLVISIVIFFSVSISLFSADKSLLINSLENNTSENYSKTKIYVKTNSDKYFVKNKFLDAGIDNIKSIEKPFVKFTKNKEKFLSDSDLDNIYLIELDNEVSIIDLCLELNKQSDIEYASPVYYKELHEYFPNDYDETKQYYLEQIDAFKSFELTKGDTNIIVGVVDSGIDINHEDLKDNIYKNYAEIPNDGIDNDENGFIDDYIGWDFVGDRNEQQLSTYSFVEDNNVLPSVSAVTHGTHVAGLVSAVTDNDTGIASIGYRVKLLPVKCTTDDLRVSRGVYQTNEALLYAYEMGADIINCSWGSTESYDAVEHDIVKTIYEGNTLMVVSAGNGSTDMSGIQFPGDYPEVLTVGSNDEDGERSYFTNYGPNVDVFGPGGGIYSTDDNNSYTEKSGTSMSSPIVAGIVALLKSAQPELTSEELQYRLKSSSIKAFVNDDKIVNAYNALTMTNLPGMKLTDFILNDGETSITENKNSITVDYINILTPVGDFNYSVTSDVFKFNIHGITSPEQNTYNIQDDFEISEQFPYFAGTADIQVELRATIDGFNYFEQEERRYPFRFKTNNKFIELAKINAYYTFWTNAQILDDMTFWGCSFINNTLYIVRFGEALNMDPIGNSFAREMQAIDKNTAFFTYENSGDQDSLSLYKVEYDDQGFIYNEMTIFPKPPQNKFHMFDKNHGIILNYYNQLQLLEYDNGEVNEITNLPDPLVSLNVEDMFLFYENGRIGIYITEFMSENMHYIYSDDMMETWTYELNQYEQQINDFAFSDDSTGMAASGYQYFYKTTDFGSTWELVDYNPENGFLSPTLVYSPENSNEFIFVYPDNVIRSTTDYGETWIYVKNYDKGFDGQLNAGRAAAANTFDNKVRVFSLFNHVEYLEYDLKPKNPEYSYNLQSDDLIDLDTININDSDSDYIMIENTGNALLTVEDIYFTNSYNNAYTFRDDKIDFISAGKSRSMFFDFTPEYVGDYPTEIVIRFKENVADIIIDVKAVADETSSVRELSKKISIYPNPANNYFEISNTSDFIFKTFSITDMTGKVVLSGKYTESMDVSKLSSGSYILTLESEIIELNKKIVIE